MANSCTLRCSGRRSCEVRIPDEAFDATRPCPKDLRRYLIADYDCIAGEYNQQMREFDQDFCNKTHRMRVENDSDIVSAL